LANLPFWSEQVDLGAGVAHRGQRTGQLHLLDPLVGDEDRNSLAPQPIGHQKLLSNYLLAQARFPSLRLFMTASPPSRPAAAEPPAISGTFARAAARETALAAALVPAAAALPARAALAAASSGAATSFEAFAVFDAFFGLFVAWAIEWRLPLPRAGKPALDGQMAPHLKEKIDARNRRQRANAQELRRGATLRQRMKRFGAEQKIKRSRERLGQQVARSKRMALRAKVKAVRARERARR
jgi:hypothetical protein